MSRRRYLSTEAGRDKALRDVAAKEPHAATFYLLSIPAAGDDRRLPAGDPDELLWEIWPSMPRQVDATDVERWCALLVEVGLWDQGADGFLMPLSFYKYQTYIRGKRRGSAPDDDTDPNAPREVAQPPLYKEGAAHFSALQRTSAQTNASLRSSFSSSVSETPSGDAPAEPVAPEPPVRPAPKPDKEPKQEGHPACRIYRQITRIGPKPAIRALMEEAIPADDEEAAVKWQQVVTAWVSRGYGEKNVDGMLEWFKDGIPPKKQREGMPAKLTPRLDPPTLPGEIKPLSFEERKAIQQRRNGTPQAAGDPAEFERKRREAAAAAAAYQPRGAAV